MGFRGTLVTTSWGAEDRSWAKHIKGFDTCRSITLNLNLFTAGTHYPNGYLPSGLALGKVTATGLYGPYDNAAVDGRTVMAGLLFNTTYVHDATASGRVTAPLFWEGIVSEVDLPLNHGVDANGKLDLPSIRFE